MSARRTTLYRFFDAEGRLLYVGITTLGPNRWAEHERHREWWDQVASSTVEQFGSREEAHAAEIAAILQEEPPYNLRHQPRPAKPAPTYRKHGEGSIIWRPKIRRWAAVITIDGRRRWFHFEREEDARAMLEVGRAAQSPAVRDAIRRLVDR